MELPEELVNQVISFQGEDAAKAAYTCKEIEFSGFGKFLLSRPKLLRKIQNMENKLAAGNVKENLESYVAHLAALKEKL